MAAGRTEYRVGTASWTDPTLLSTDFYPPDCRTAAARLRYYASLFSTVEVDSTYYALPSERNARLWADRTPADFDFNVKAFAWLTGHDTDPRRLPLALRAELSRDELARPRLRAPSDSHLRRAFEMFRSALDPLRRAGKLGCLLLQFPPWFRPTDENRAYLLRCRSELPEDRIAVEFRHPGWFGGNLSSTLRFLEQHDLLFVSLDTPGGRGVPPPTCAATGQVAYVRFHGRNREAWFRPATSAAERFRYLYGQEELAAWARKLRDLPVEKAYVIFNNCYADYGVRNALTMKRLLSE
ncbi:MAG: hypothetical protein KatS3mg076_0651 [Candidatus Binatia bacterium]|nr:MAG: hypothetical protein KatS3mg076_0651 [Candidatus Binatia bacterium]